jgi:hypothetical protein
MLLGVPSAVQFHLDTLTQMSRDSTITSRSSGLQLASMSSDPDDRSSAARKLPGASIDFSLAGRGGDVGP